MSEADSARRQPNILLFMTDDHGQWASRCYGNRELHTPSMDYLAETGVRMTRAFTPSPVCSPARACFYTGRLPSQHGVHDWLSETTAPDHPALEGQTNIAQLLQAGGYETALVGKWHCGPRTKPAPGFDLWSCASQGPHFGDVRFFENGEDQTRHGYHSALVTDRAIQFLRERDTGENRRPFFLNVGYTDTHSPHTGLPPHLAAQYSRCSFEDIPREKPSASYRTYRSRLPATPEIEREWRIQYYAAVEMIDQQIGRLLGELEARGELENTLIIYTSDHGHMNGHHGLWWKGNTAIPQNFLEESILVPCLLSWRGQLPTAKVCAAMVDHCDLFWTVLDAAGVEVDEKTRREIRSPGQSYLPLLKGQEDDPWRDAFYGDYGNARAIRTSRYKYIQRFPGPNGAYPDELYDLEADPREERNVFGVEAFQPIVQELKQRVEEHFARYEFPQRSGRDIAHQPICNAGEPWRWVPPET